MTPDPEHLNTRTPDPGTGHEQDANRASSHRSALGLPLSLQPTPVGGTPALRAAFRSTDTRARARSSRRRIPRHLIPSPRDPSLRICPRRLRPRPRLRHP
jgi:hypothetical protein